MLNDPAFIKAFWTIVCLFGLVVIIDSKTGWRLRNYFSGWALPSLSNPLAGRTAVIRWYWGAILAGIAAMAVAAYYAPAIMEWWRKAPAPAAPAATAVPAPATTTVPAPAVTDNWWDSLTTAGWDDRVLVALALLLAVALVAGFIIALIKGGWRMAAFFAAIALIVLVAVYWTAVWAWVGGITTLSHQDFWTAVIVLLGIILIAHWVLNRSHSDPWVVAVRTIAVVLLLFVAGPSLARWINSNTPGCIGSDETCRQAQAQRAADEAKTAYARQLAVEKAKRDAMRLVSPVCPGGRNHLDLRAGENREINPFGCAIHSVTTRGAIIYVGRWGTRSEPIGRNGGRINQLSTSVEAPAGTPSSLDYVLCTGDGRIPVDDTCLPLQRSAALP